MKPKLIIYDTNRDVTTKVVLKFAQGASRDSSIEVRFQKIDKFKKNGLDKTLRPGIDAVASLGILRGTGEMFHAAKDAGIDYYYMDHAYYEPGYGGSGWMRIVKNNHTMSWLRRSNGNRYNNFFKNAYPIETWKSNTNRGDQIVICPPTNAVSWYTKMNYNWTDHIVAQIKSLLPEKEHSRILVRPKPSEPLVDNAGNLLGFKQNEVESSLDEDLKNAKCVIAFNSMVALTATLQGIPVIGSNYSCCKSISFEIHDLVRPAVFDREPVNRTNLLHWLADNQWNMQEIQNGTAWQKLQENNQ
jgi:hypothetical protein